MFSMVVGSRVVKVVDAWIDEFTPPYSPNSCLSLERFLTGQYVFSCMGCLLQFGVEISLCEKWFEFK